MQEAEKVLSDYSLRSGCRILHAKQDKAYYSPSLDEVHLPLREQFPDIREYYSTAFHECTHSTGHEKRLNRLAKGAFFGDSDYSKEELVAEIGAALLMNDLGIESPATFKNSTAYIQNWLTALRNDSHLVVSAAGKAEKAVRLILNLDVSEQAEAA